MSHQDSDQVVLPDSKFSEWKRLLVQQQEDSKNEIKELRKIVHRQNIEIEVLKTKVLMMASIAALVVSVITSLLSKAV